MPKPVRYIEKVKNSLVRPCPGAVNCFCCNYVVVSQILNCPFNCSYCFLHTFFGKDEIVIFKDEAEVVRQVKDYLKQTKEPIHLGTGEYSDSLALPEAVSLGKALIKVFAEQEKHLLELKTKSVNIEQLLKLDHKGKTVIAWSVNPEKIAKEEESDAPSLNERLKAAKKVAAAGYPIAFHFDPIIYYSGWEKDYAEVVDRIFNHVNENQIAWISLGALRFPERQKEIMIDKFKTKISFEHFEKGIDNKLRYPVPLRVELFTYLYNQIRSRSKQVYVYLCMENPEVWKAARIKSQSSNKYAKFFRFFQKR